MDLNQLRQTLSSGRWHDQLILSHLPEGVSLKDATDQQLLGAFNALIELPSEPELAWRPELDRYVFHPDFWMMRDRLTRFHQAGHPVSAYEDRLIRRAVLQLSMPGRRLVDNIPCLQERNLNSATNRLTRSLTGCKNSSP